MQIIKVARLETKEGISKKNGKPYTQYIVHGEDGSSVSTFDMMAASIQAGDSIEAEVEVSGKYTNLKSFKVPGHAVQTTPTASAPTPFAPSGSQKPPTASIPVVGRTTDDRIAEQVAVKAVVELAVGGVLEPTHPLVVAVKSWCSDKLRGYLSMFPIDTPKTAEKPLETPPEGKLPHENMDKEMVLNSIMHRLKLTSQPSALKWLTTVTKISSERLENEPEAVYNEIKAKLNWS